MPVPAHSRYHANAGWGMRESSKSQAPTPRKAPSSKHQILKAVSAIVRRRKFRCPSRGPGVWNLGFPWSLEVGAWGFGSGHPSQEPRASKQSFFEGFGHRAAAGVDVELGIDVPQVGVHGVITEGKFIGDFLFDQTLGH